MSITSKGGYYIVSFPTNKGPNMITRDKKTKQYYMTNLVTRESLLLNLNDVSRGGNLLVNIKKGHVESNGKVYVSVNHVYINNKNINGVISIDNKGHAILKKETLLLNNHIVNLTLK